MFECENLQFYLYIFIVLFIVFFGLTVTFIYFYVKKRKKLSSYKSNESALIKEAYYDSTTNLPNKLNVDRTINEQIVRCTRRNKVFSTAIVKIDNLNEIYNTEIQKAILLESANHLSKAVRNEDLVAYILDGNFVIVFNEYLDEAYLETIFRRISNLFKKELQIMDKLQKVKISIGVAKYPQNATTPQELMNFAMLNRK